MLAHVRLGCIALVLLFRPTAPDDQCDAPAYFGICDPFVPGTVIASARDGELILVLDTWPAGPAERAGICPGDRIVAVNLVSVFGSTYEGVLRELVSPVAARVRLRVRRSERELEFEVDRVRETELAARSGRKFLRARAVALDQSVEGLDRLERLRRGHYAARGLKPAGREWVPADMPDAQVELYKALLARIRVPLARVTSPMFESRDDWIAGMSLLVLGEPAGVWVRGVLPGSHAQGAGVHPGDELLEIDGQPTAGLDREAVGRLLLGNRGPRRVSLKLRGESSVSEVSIETERAAALLAQPFGLDSIGDSRTTSPGTYFLGVVLLRSSPLDETIVEDVVYDSPAWRAGVHIGDVPIAIDGTRVHALGGKEIEAVLSPAGSRPVRLEVTRGDSRHTFELAPETWDAALARIGRRLGRNGPVPKTCPD